MTINADQISRPEPKRDRYGRYVLPDTKGNSKSFTRATTISSTIEDRYNLERWKQRMTAYGLAQRSDLLALAATHHPKDDRGTFDEIVDKAMEAAESGAAAAMGTAIHKATETLDAGTPLDKIPAQFQAHLERYQRKLAAAGVEIDPDGIERLIIHDEYGIAGLSDRLPLILADGRRVVGDLKTGSELRYSWLAISIQLAIYANHTATYNLATGKRGPRVDVDTNHGLIVHLPAGGDTCDLYLVDIAQGFDAFLTAMEVRDLRKRPERLAEAYQPDSVGTGGASALTDWIRDRIRAVAETGGGPAANDLRTRWPDIVPKPLPVLLTETQVDALDNVLARVERRHEIPFGPGRPGVEHHNNTTAKAEA